MRIRDTAFEEWWPATQSLDLIAGAADRVADAIFTELVRILPGESVLRDKLPCEDFGSALSLAPDFSNVPTMFLVLPTHSEWSVLWVNSFLCDGYDSLCHCVTENHDLTTMHWSAHDAATTVQAGASFTYRANSSQGRGKRSVYAGENDGRWTFLEVGTPLPQEDLKQYQLPRKRDRLNESTMQKLLGRMGAQPWTESFYAFPGTCHVFRRPSAPSSIVRRPVASVCVG